MPCFQIQGRHTITLPSEFFDDQPRKIDRHRSIFMSSSASTAFRVALILFGMRLPAQLTVSTIRGNAMDASGAAVTGAAITLVNLGTNIQRSVDTNESGEFEIPDLQ